MAVQMPNWAMFIGAKPKKLANGGTKISKPSKTKVMEIINNTSLFLYIKVVKIE